MPDDLRAGAATVRRLTGARLVVFGHTHREDEADGYLNLGAFGDLPRPSRTYVRIDTDGRAERLVFRPAVGRSEDRPLRARQDDRGQYENGGVLHRSAVFSTNSPCSMVLTMIVPFFKNG